MCSPVVSRSYTARISDPDQLRSHHRTRSRRLRRLTTLLACWLPLMLAGCGAGGLSRDVASIRLLHASPDTPALDLYVNDLPLAYGVRFGTQTSYIPVGPGSYALHADLAGSRRPFVATASRLIAGRQYTAVVADIAGALRINVLPDGVDAIPSGAAAVRVVNEAVLAGELDVYLIPNDAAGTPRPPLAKLAVGKAAPYQPLPATTYTVEVYPAGAYRRLSFPVLTSPQVEMLSGSVHTLVLLDQLSAPGAIRVLFNEDDTLTPAH